MLYVDEGRIPEWNVSARTSPIGRVGNLDESNRVAFKIDDSKHGVGKDESQGEHRQGLVTLSDIGKDID